MREMSAGKLNPHGFIKYHVPMQQMGPFLISEERVPGHSEQYTWCTCWNGDQTERTSHTYESCMWA